MKKGRQIHGDDDFVNNKDFNYFFNESVYVVM